MTNGALFDLYAVIFGLACGLIAAIVYRVARPKRRPWWRDSGRSDYIDLTRKWR
jgi:hypothetical protein